MGGRGRKEQEGEEIELDGIVEGAGADMIVVFPFFGRYDEGKG